eukprot:UC4_evm1s1544
MSVTIKRAASGADGTKKIAPLGELAALSLGTEVLAESIILSVAIGIVTIEYSIKDAESKMKKKEELLRLQKFEDKIVGLEKHVDVINSVLARIHSEMREEKYRRMKAEELLRRQAN